MFGKDKNQKSREKVLYEGQPNMIVYNTSVLWALIVLGFLFTLYGQGVATIGSMQVYAISSVKQPLTTYFAIAVLVLIIATLAFIAIKILSWTAVKYTITESRVIVEKGIIFNKQNSMPFNTIQDVSRSQSIFGRIFSVGTIELYSAYDGKDLKIEDISGPKKVEDLIFENLRGTHLRTPVDFDGGYSNDFSPASSAESGHYRRMEDLDDLTLVNAKEQKKMQREIRRQARRNKYRKEHPKYGSQDGYDTKYGSSYNEGGYYDGGPDLQMDNRSRGTGYNPKYGKSHRGSGAIRQSYRQNPDKYFADNYEEFHQNNLNQDNYSSQSYGDSGYSSQSYGDSGYSNPRQGSSNRSYRPSGNNDNYNRSGDAYRSDRSGDAYRSDRSDGAYEKPVQNESYGESSKKRPKGAVERIKSFNIFGSSNEKEEDISDREFDEAIDQAMQNMEGSIKFQPNPQNDSLNYESYSPDGFEDDFDYSSPYQHNTQQRKAVYYEDDSQYADRAQGARDSRDSDYHGYNDYKHSNAGSSKPYSKGYDGRKSNYRGNNSRGGNYRGSNNYNQQRGAYRDSSSRDGSYRDSNPREGAYRDSSYEGGYRDSNSREGGYRDSGYEGGYRDSSSRDGGYKNRYHYEDNYRGSNPNQSGDYESGESSDDKNSDDLFAKHSKKFRKH